VDYRGVFCG